MVARIWIVVAALFVVVAVIFLWRNNISAAFVTATLGAVAWFLNYRSQLRASIAVDEPPEAFTEDRDEN